MKILFLGPADSLLVEFLLEFGETVFTYEEPIYIEFLENFEPEFLISYGYRHILKQEILDFFNGNAINLHISLLPWNRGADPNFWSFIENSPKGVTIHFLDAGVDTGDIITQKEVLFQNLEQETLRTTYNKLQEEIQVLFKQTWEVIRDGTCQRIKQEGEGSYHRMRDKEPLLYLLTNEWDTPVSILMDKTKQQRNEDE